MMGRKAEIDFYGYGYEVSVNGAGAKDGVEPADIETSGWFPHFPHYNEDAQGRLLYLYQPITASLANVRYDVNWRRDHPRSHFGEVFEAVDIMDVGDLDHPRRLNTLHAVTFLEALDRLVAALQARDAALRAKM